MPPVRKRSRWALTLAEREEISRGLATARSIRQIAATLGRAPRFSEIAFEPGQLCCQIRHGPSALPQRRELASPGSTPPVLERCARHGQASGCLWNRHLLFQDQLHRLLPELLRLLLSRCVFHPTPPDLSA